MDLKKSLENDMLVYNEWLRFINGKKVDRNIVREVVLKGWELFKERDFDPYSNNIIRVSQEELDRYQKESALLLECADSILKKVFCGEMASISNIILSNEQGVILYKLQARSGEKFCTPNEVGCTTSQGILTCLSEKTSINIIGAEHYCRPQQHFCCHVTPVFGSYNKLVGVLSMGVVKEASHFLVETLLESAAVSIGEQLRLRETLEEHSLVIELFDNGIVIFDNEGIVCTFNNKARSIFNLKNSPVGKNIEEIFKKNNFVNALRIEHRMVQKQQTDFIAAENGLHVSCLLSTSYIASGNYYVLQISQAQIIQEKLVSSEYVRFDDIIGESELFAKAVGMAKQIAKTDITTMLLGESGTGKDLIAQAIHMDSLRASKPFITINCGAIPRDLLQSTLFGYEPGAFTGASQKGFPGIFEQADKGTLFLDEIGEMPLEDQASLLRVLQNKEVVRLGGTKKYKVDVRIITATNKDLEKAVQQKLFREDLYYRLNVFPISIPSLRERRSDIEMLATYFYKKFKTEISDAPTGIDAEVMDCFGAYDWPGNVRELKNIMERLMNLVHYRKIQLQDLPERFLTLPELYRAKESSAVFLPDLSLEAEEIEQALQRNNGNVKKAASELNLSRAGLYYKMKALNLNPGQYRKAVTGKQEVNKICCKDKSTAVLDNVNLSEVFSKQQLQFLFKVLQNSIEK